jgi:hypothetical protein
MDKKYIKYKKKYLHLKHLKQSKLKHGGMVHLLNIFGRNKTDIQPVIPDIQPSIATRFTDDEIADFLLLYDDDEYDINIDQIIENELEQIMKRQHITKDQAIQSFKDEIQIKRQNRDYVDYINRARQIRQVRVEQIENERRELIRIRNQNHYMDYNNWKGIITNICRYCFNLDILKREENLNIHATDFHVYYNFISKLISLFTDVRNPVSKKYFLNILITIFKMNINKNEYLHEGENIHDIKLSNYDVISSLRKNMSKFFNVLELKDFKKLINIIYDFILCTNYIEPKVLTQEQIKIINENNINVTHFTSIGNLKIIILTFLKNIIKYIDQDRDNIILEPLRVLFNSVISLILHSQEEDIYKIVLIDNVIKNITIVLNLLDRYSKTRSLLLLSLFNNAETINSIYDFKILIPNIAENIRNVIIELKYLSLYNIFTYERLNIDDSERVKKNKIKKNIIFKNIELKYFIAELLENSDDNSINSLINLLFGTNKIIIKYVQQQNLFDDNILDERDITIFINNLTRYIDTLNIEQLEIIIKYLLLLLNTSEICTKSIDLYITQKNNNKIYKIFKNLLIPDPDPDPELEPEPEPDHEYVHIHDIIPEQRQERQERQERQLQRQRQELPLQQEQQAEQLPVPRQRPRLVRRQTSIIREARTRRQKLDILGLPIYLLGDLRPLIIKLLDLFNQVINILKIKRTLGIETQHIIEDDIHTLITNLKEIIKKIINFLNPEPETKIFNLPIMTHLSYINDILKKYVSLGTIRNIIDITRFISPILLNIGIKLE